MADEPVVGPTPEEIQRKAQEQIRFELRKKLLEAVKPISKAIGKQVFEAVDSFLIHGGLANVGKNEMFFEAMSVLLGSQVAAVFLTLLAATKNVMVANVWLEATLAQTAAELQAKTGIAYRLPIGVVAPQSSDAEAPKIVKAN